MCTLFAPHHASLVISLLLWNSSASGGITRILTPGGEVRTLSITKSVHKRQRIPKKTFSLPSSVCVAFSPQTVLFPQTVQVKKNKTKQLRQINWVEHLKQNYTNSCNLMNLLNSKKLTLLETNEIKLLSQPTCWWGQLSSVPSNFKYDMDTRTVGAGQQLLSFRGCTKCAKQGERDCVKGVCVTGWPYRWERGDGVRGLLLFFRHCAFRNSLVFTLEQQETWQPYGPSAAG